MAKKKNKKKNDGEMLKGNSSFDPTDIGGLEVKYTGMVDRDRQLYAQLSSLSNYEFAVDQTAADFKTAVKTQAIQEEMAREGFINQMKQRDIQMNAQLEAFERNQQFIANQLKYNEAGAQRAVKDADTILADRVTQVDFQREALDLQQQEQNLDTATAKAQAELTDFQLDQDKRLTDAEADRNKITADEAARIQFEQQQSSANYQLKQRKAEAAYAQQQVQLQTIAQRGQQRAMGRKGVSASRAEQTILALAGVNTTRLTQELLRFETEESKQAKLRGEARTLSEQQATDAQTTAKKRAQARVNVGKAETKLKVTRAEEIQTIATNRLEMNRRELGETLISALNGYEQSKEQIFLDKFQADTNAYAQRMLEPQFADAPKEPFKLPKIKFEAPPPPLEIPKGDTPQPQKRSTLSQLLTIGGMVASAVAVPMTGGASTPSTTAIWAAGLGAGAQGIGTSGWLD